MTKIVSGKWEKSYLANYVYFDTTCDGYTKPRNAYVVKAIDGTFYPVVHEDRYGTSYREKRFKKFDTFEKAYKYLKEIIGVRS